MPSAGNGLYEHLDWSFADKQKKGFTYQGTTRQYAVMLGEFGSTLADRAETTCMQSILTYMNNHQPAKYSHLPITSWNFWCPPPLPPGTHPPPTYTHSHTHVIS